MARTPRLVVYPDPASTLANRHIKQGNGERRGVYNALQVHDQPDVAALNADARARSADVNKTAASLYSGVPARPAEEVRKEMEFGFAGRVEDVLAAVLPGLIRVRRRRREG